MSKEQNADTRTEALTFPKPSRSYDDTVHGVRFWGYDRTFEIAFFVAASAFPKLDPETRADEAGYLNTFDANRHRIREVAGNVYARRRRSAYVYSYTLTDTDF